MIKDVKHEAATEVASFAASEHFPKTKEILNQAVADLYTARIALHQVHWYMRGRGFMTWHPRMDKYMDSLAEVLDEISERLITIGGSPYSTLTEFIQHSKIEEKEGNFHHSIEENLERVLEIFRYLVSLYQEGMDISDEEGDAVSNDIFFGAKADLEKTIWMIAAELGQAPGI